MPFSLSSLLGLLGATAAYAQQSSGIQPYLTSCLSPGAQIFLPSWANYTQNVQQRWTDWYEPKFVGAIKPATVADIQCIVKAAAAHSVPIFATGAGHGSSETLGRLKNGADIDLGNFAYANYDTNTQQLTIGGATKFQAMWDVLQPHLREVPAGSIQCVGAMSATLGGGLGSLQGVHGLALDSLVSVKLVTANGSYVTASKTSNSDLFWAVKGAGFNFGIVTEATFVTYPSSYGGIVSEADFVFPGPVNASFFKVL